MRSSARRRPDAAGLDLGVRSSSACSQRPPRAAPALAPLLSPSPAAGVSSICFLTVRAQASVVAAASSVQRRLLQTDIEMRSTRAAAYLLFLFFLLVSHRLGGGFLCSHHSTRDTSFEQSGSEMLR